MRVLILALEKFNVPRLPQLPCRDCENGENIIGEVIEQLTHQVANREGSHRLKIKTKGAETPSMNNHSTPQEGMISCFPLQTSNLTNRVNGDTSTMKGTCCWDCVKARTPQEVADFRGDFLLHIFFQIGVNELDEERFRPNLENLFTARK